MIRKLLLAAVMTAGFADLSSAQDPITVLGTGENFAVDYSNDGGNILGGGVVTVTGNGEGAVYHHAANAPAQHGWTARFVGQGESGRIAYTPADNANPRPAG